MSSPAWFTNELIEEDYFLRLAFPDSSTSSACEHHRPSPRRRSFISLGLQIEEEEKKSIVIPHYQWLSKQVAFLLSGFYGKLIVSHGYLEKGDQFWVPELTIDPIPYFDSPPFNDKPRKATSIKPDVSICKGVLADFLFRSDSGDWSRIIAACESYHGALRFLSSDPMLAFVLILSGLEVLSLGCEVSDEDIFDERFYGKMLAIKSELKDGLKIYKELRSRLYQISQRTAIYVDQILDDPFYTAHESREPFMSLQPENIKQRIKAAYGLRSKYLHTGQSIGGWARYDTNMRADIVLGDPVVGDSELKKMISRSPTLNGLERIFQYCLFQEIQIMTANKS